MSKRSEYEEPIIPIDRNGTRALENSIDSKGWRFYMKIRDYLPEWWYEFNGAINPGRNKVRCKYKSIKAFSIKKLKHKEERQFLIWMIGPRRIWDEEAISHKPNTDKSKKVRHVVPWLGDWKRRRRNGYWEVENKEHIKGLSRAIKENVDSMQAIRATAPFIVSELMRWIRLHEKVDEVFDGKPLLMDEEPDSKNNIKRYNLYTRMHEDVQKKVSHTIKDWMRIHGVNPNNPHEMADMATLAQMAGQSAAMGAVGGLAAGLGFNSIPNGNGEPSGSNLLQVGESRVVITPDALLLANHLTKHSELFKKPLPPIEGVGKIIQDEEENKSNGKSKTNGHSKAN